MDVLCSSCAEPWDVYHLRHDVINDVAINEGEAASWRKLTEQKRLSPHYRKRFKAAGWQFGASVLDVRHCPACPKGAQTDPEKAAIKNSVIAQLGDDEDGIASTLEDLGL